MHASRIMIIVSIGKFLYLIAHTLSMLCVCSFEFYSTAEVSMCVYE